MSRHRPIRALCALLAAFVMAGSLPLAPAWAVEPEERLDDPVLEARAREISRELRCVVCAGEVIDYSNADIARELRVLVRDRLLAGDSDDEVKEYIVERYGEYVLMRPRFNARNFLLWGGPVMLLLAGGTLAAVFIRRQRGDGAVAEAAAPLTPAEQRALAAMIATQAAAQAGDDEDGDPDAGIEKDGLV